MTSNRPYLLRAIYEWILDNNMTPYLVVDSGENGIKVPDELSRNDQIILNIYPDAVRDLLLTNDGVSFNARFSGVAHSIYLPINSIRAIYSKETGRGIIFDQDFDDEETEDLDIETDNEPSKQSHNKHSHLRVIK